MTDYREILRLHSLGHSIHGIALGVPCARNTASAPSCMLYEFP